MAPKAKKNYKDFESALARLEELTEQLESGELQLEESISLYSEGLEIAKFCNARLTEAEKKIKIIAKDNGGVSEQEFEQEET
jgi:exodeoxyribonuclease VII small subunit